MTSAEAQETSEEVRLLLINLTLSMVWDSGPEVQSKLGDLVALACAALHDSSPDIKRASPG